MLSKLENTSGNGGSWKKLNKIHCHRADSVNATIDTQFGQLKPILFHSLLFSPFLADIHEFQKEAHVLKIDSLYHVTHAALCGKNNWTTQHLLIIINFYLNP